MRKNIYLLFLLTCALGLVLFGCGKKQESPTTTQNPSSQTEQQQPTIETAQLPAEEENKSSAVSGEKQPESNSSIESKETSDKQLQTAENTAKPKTEVSSKPLQTSTNTPTAPENQTAQTPKQNDASTQAQPAKPAAPELTPFEQYLQGLPGRINTENTQGVTCTYQFNITEGHPGLYWVSIKDNKCTTGKGPVSSPDITVNVGEQLWLDIAADKVNGTMAYLSKKFTAEGNTDYLSNMKKYFKK